VPEIEGRPLDSFSTYVDHLQRDGRAKRGESPLKQGLFARKREDIMTLTEPCKKAIHSGERDILGDSPEKGMSKMDFTKTSEGSVRSKSP
jgi:hypothetical protein